MQTGKGYADVEGLCYKMSFNYEMAKHPDPFTEATGFNGPVLLVRAADDKLVDDKTLKSYAKVYQNAQCHTLEKGGHNFASLPARAEVEEVVASFIYKHI